MRAVPKTLTRTAEARSLLRPPPAASIEAQPWKIVGFAIYSASLLALFCLSTLHHGIEGPDWLERGLRIADYCAIFPLIAGSFTPICLVFLHGSGFGWGLLGTLWFLAACGIALTISAFDHLPRWVTLAMFGTMGWMGAVLAAAIYPDVGLGGVSLIAAGGLAYSAGGVIYDMVRATPRSRFVTRFWRCSALQQLHGSSARARRSGPIPPARRACSAFMRSSTSLSSWERGCTTHSCGSMSCRITRAASGEGVCHSCCFV